MTSHSQVIEVAKMLIHCKSITPVTAGVFDIIEAYLVPHGFTAERFTFEEPGFDTVENLWIRYGTGTPHLCFAGHTDVVPPGDDAHWTVPPFTPQVIDGELYGRGAEDMKGAIAAFMVAAKHAVQNGVKGSLSLLITQDEEGWAVNGTRKVLQKLKERGEIPDHCIVGEPTNPEELGEMIKIGRRGSVSFHIVVNGRQGHVAYPDMADNPVTRLVNMLHALKAEKIDEGNAHFPPSNLEISSIDVGNPTYNVIPAKAEARVNVRFNNLHTSAAIESWVRKRIAHFGEADVAVRVTGEPFLTEDKQLTSIIVSAVKKVTGRDPKLSTTGGTSDARFIKDYCPVVEFGATGRTSHMVDERVKTATLESLVTVYQQVIAGYFR